MVGAYLQSEDERGFGYAPSKTPDWHQFAVLPDPQPPNDGWISALTCAPDDPEKLYAVWVDDRYLRVSTNGGTSWSRSSEFQPLQGSPPFGSNRPSTFSLLARSGGELFRLNGRNGDIVWSGFWRSLDDGLTWTRILSLPSSISGGGYMALGTTKLWYAFKTTSTLWDIRRANFDGSGVEVLVASESLSSVFQMLVRAFDDTFALVIHTSSNVLWKVTTAGKVDIRPSALRPWDAIPLDASVFVAAGTPTSGGSDVVVYRTTDAGANWTLVKTIPAAEGFALNGATGSYRMLDASTPMRTDLVMPGNAAFNVQQSIWVSSDTGLTWTKILNEAAPFDVEWLVYGPGGILARPDQAAVASQLVTILG